MKKTLTILLCCVLLCGLLAACGQTELTDGQYTIEVELAGGTGRATVASPAVIAVKGDNITATIVWSSPYYEYMLVDGVQYAPVQTEGNATFDIPIVLDADMAVSASTIAMSEPHLIDYTLRFSSSTIKGV